MLDMTCVRGLTVEDIPDPLAVEIAAVKEHHRGFCAVLTVAGVAEAFAVRTVGGDRAVHIGQLGTEERFIEKVQPLGR